MNVFCPPLAALQPIVTAISPTFGPATGGVSLTVTGQNFDAVVTATVGGVACAVTQRVDSTKVSEIWGQDGNSSFPSSACLVKDSDAS